jgi:valyl-tRNA synthetase
MLAQLAALIDEATRAYENYDYARALERTEAFFWKFCDQYLELVKQRAYGSAGPGPQASAQTALQLALSALLRLFAPVLPFVCEEVWGWWQSGSVHRATWPNPTEFGDLSGAEPAVLDVAAATLSEIRRAKTEAKRSLRTEVSLAVVRADATTLAALGPASGDVIDAGAVLEFRTETADAELSVEVTLVPDPEPADG